MRALVISDIHANLSALESVLANAGGVDAVWCLGDVVGYGPDPNECIAMLKSLDGLECLQGNHDAAAVGDLPLESFNAEARSSIEWLRNNLSQASLDFLRAVQPRSEMSDVTLVHASPRQPMLEYLLDTYSAGENFSYFLTDFCFVGHTHVPVLFTLSSDDTSLEVPVPNTTYTLQRRCIANPGSVGQPRDRDPRAAYAIYDDAAQTWDYHRVEYNVSEVQRRMETARLPERHIQRLASGW
jgi:diadenosine tetraphosphatase ApaH/serine/threonine PP2A family protein phosphatase